MNFFEFIGLAKLFLQVYHGGMTLSEAELEAVTIGLKQLGDNQQNWSPQQKELYKAMVDFAKENTRR